MVPKNSGDSEEASIWKCQGHCEFCTRLRIGLWAYGD